MNIQLIQPEKSKGYCSNSRTGCYLPLGLISIATYTQKEFPDAEIEVFDGELITNKQIIDKLKSSSVVGIETKTPNYASALEIAKAAKEMGSKVIFGGVYASAIPQTIMEHRADIVDHIVVGFGEKPFVEILKGNSQKIIYNQQASFDQLPTPDRASFVDIENYVSNFRKEHPTWNPRGTNIFTHMGCKYKCLFCSRQGPKGTTCFRSQQKIWEEVTSLVNEHNIDYIVDFSDAITQNLRWLKKLVEVKPPEIKPLFHVFSTAADINKKTLRLLGKLNVRHIFIGIETGDPLLARRVMKGENFSPKTSLKAARSAAEAGMSITPSFVLGLPGETEESLESTYRLAEKIKEISDFEEIFCSALIPFPGSIAFKQLKLKHKLDSDLLDAEELKRLWAESFCKADYETIIDYSEKILELGKYTITIRGQGSRQKTRNINPIQ